MLDVGIKGFFSLKIDTILVKNQKTLLKSDFICKRKN
jgi:hypothetical protein